MDVEIIDLISPPASPRREDENEPAPGVKSGQAAAPPPAGVKFEQAAAPAPSAKALGKRKALQSVDERETRSRGSRREPKYRDCDSSDDDDDDDDDDDFEEVQQVARIQDDGMDVDGEGDELQFVGRTGANALMDFPHARENCVSHPFTRGKESSCCANCFCFVCDDHASKCSKWSEHCVATHTLAQWRDARQAWRIA